MFAKLFRHLRNHVLPNAENNYTPHLVEHRSLSLYAVFLFSFKVLTLCSLVLLPQAQAFSSALTSQNILDLTNYSRQAVGLKPLSENRLLDAAAQAKAEDMLKNQYFAHVSPQRLTPWDFIKAAGYNYVVAGENLAINYYSAEGVSEAWMESPEHRANILNSDFQDIGIGIVQGQYQGNQVVFVVQEFGSDMNQPYQALSASTELQTYAQPQPSVQMPKQSAGSSTAAAPIFNGSQTQLTNKTQFQVSGSAVGESTVYILVNNQPQTALQVVNGTFSGTVQLSSGSNSLTSVAFNSAGQASKVSAVQQIIVSTQPPKILNSQIKPSGNANTYVVQVSIQGSAVKVLATVGSQTFFLQPSDSSSTSWQGIVSASGADLQDPISISAYDLAGNISVQRVSLLSSNILNSYGFMATPSHTVNVLGHNFAITYFDNIYWFVILAVLLVLLITIGVKKHIQHLDVIAEASGFVVVALVIMLI